VTNVAARGLDVEALARVLVYDFGGVTNYTHQVRGAVWCSVVQCGAVCCSVSRVYDFGEVTNYSHQVCGAVWCSVVQCGAVWCSVVQ